MPRGAPSGPIGATPSKFSLPTEHPRIPRHARRLNCNATPEGWQQTMSVFIAPLKPHTRARFVVLFETSPAGFYRGDVFRPRNCPRIEATFEAIGGFTGNTFCELAFDLKMFRGIVVGDRNIVSFIFCFTVFCSQKFVLWVASVCAGLPNANIAGR